MKKYRPYCAGFIVVYVLSLLCLADAGFSIFQKITGTENEMMASFSFFTYLIAIVAVIYSKQYIATRVEIGGGKMRIVYPVYIRPRADQKRVMFLFRQGDTDFKQVDKTFKLADLEKYGWIEDLGYARLDCSNAGEKNKLFPVHEIALVMQDGKRYHLNLAFYSPAQRKGIVSDLIAQTGIQPTGKLIEELKYEKK